MINHFFCHRASYSSRRIQAKLKYYIAAKVLDLGALTTKICTSLQVILKICKLFHLGTCPCVTIRTVQITILFNTIASSFSYKIQHLSQNKIPITTIKGNIIKPSTFSHFMKMKIPKMNTC